MPGSPHLKHSPCSCSGAGDAPQSEAIYLLCVFSTCLSLPLSSCLSRLEDFLLPFLVVGGFIFVLLAGLIILIPPTGMAFE